MLTDLLAALAEPSPLHRNAVGEDVLSAFLKLPITEQLAALTADVRRLPLELRGQVVKALGASLGQPFIPLPGPQTMALNSEADELLFGGAAGGSKSYLLLGCAATRHHRSLILRRQSTELDGLISDLLGMFEREEINDRGEVVGVSLPRGHSFNKVDKEYAARGLSIKLGGMQYPDDWRGYAGRPRDFMGFDEAGEFLEEQVSSLLGWLRSTNPDQRCRAILASNPPRGAEGQWLVEWFAPWLDPTFPEVAQPGQLRWFIRVKSKTRWVEGAGEYEVDGETYTARSRTFVPALLDDNPFLARTEYRATLQSLPEPLRSQLLKGDFLAGREDDAWQVIPSDWIMAARQRWHERPNMPMTAMGVDIAQGGSDQTCLSARHGSWFAPLKVHEGIDTKDGPSVAALVFAAMRDGCGIAVDLGGGWGGSTYDHLTGQEIAVDGVVPSEGSGAKTRDGKLGFVNRRAELWWKFREALDPETGSYIALPPDPALAADLATPRWKLSARGVQVELKEEIRKRLGRSPDRGDAVVMAWGCRAESKVVRMASHQMPTHANVGHASAKRFLRRQ